MEELEVDPHNQLGEPQEVQVHQYIHWHNEDVHHNTRILPYKLLAATGRGLVLCIQSILHNQNNKQFNLVQKANSHLTLKWLVSS